MRHGRSLQRSFRGSFRGLLLSFLAVHSASAATAFAEESIEPGDEMVRRFKPSISLQWFNLSSSQQSPKAPHGTWIGLRGEAEVRLLAHEALDFGLSGHYFSSLFRLNRLGDSQISDGSAHAVLRAKFPAFWAGRIHLHLSGGYFTHSTGDRGQSEFLPDFRGPQIKGAISTTFDDALRFGVLSSYTWSHQGLFELGGFLEHEIFSGTGALSSSRWHFRMAVTAARAQVATENETWSSVQLGLAGEI